jgi:glycosyltransferase involved in cell wall biosynthesis/ADP-heptose:LPS heptosyltransferase
MRLVIDLQGAQTSSRFRGIGRYSISIAKAIAKVGTAHDIVVVLSALLPDAIEEIREELREYLPPEDVRIWKGVGPTRELEPGNEWRRGVSERIRETYLASLQPDAILIPSLFEGLNDDAVCTVDQLGHGIPTAVVLHDLIPFFDPDEEFRRNARLRKWYRRKIQSLRRSRMLFCVSENSRREALRTGLFAEDSAVTISAACGDQFRPLRMGAEERLALWKRLGISRQFVMYTGAADERKNLHRLMKSYAALPAGVRREHQLVFAGMMTKDNAETYLRAAREVGLADDELVLTGYIKDRDLIGLYSTCKLFAFPSTQEGFGLPPLEAMSCGAPVIASNATSIPEVVGPSEGLFDPLSIPEIRAQLERALTDRNHLSQLREHSLRQCRRFSWERSAEAAIRALESFAPGTAPRASRVLTIESTAHFRERRIRILVIKLDHMGDFLLAIPALSKLRARYPHASISIVVGSWNVPIARELKIFDEVHAFDFFKRRSSERPSMLEASIVELVGKMGRFDLAIDLRRQSESRFLLLRVDADLRIGYCTLDDSVDCELDVALPTYSDESSRPTQMNMTSVSIQMIRIVDAIPADPNDFIVLPKLVDGVGRLPGRVAIFPRAGSPAREWSRSNFEQLVELLSGDPLVKGIDIYFADETDCGGFALPVAGKVESHIGLDFKALAHSLSRAAICVANNSGGAHLSSYLGVTTIGIYSGHELPLEWGPQFSGAYVVHRAVHCAPCHGGRVQDRPNNLFCLTDIPVDSVYRKVIEILAKGGEAPRLRPDTACSPEPRLSYQYNTNSLVRNLLSEIAQIADAPEKDIIDVAHAISANHPDYLLPEFSRLKLNVPLDHTSAHIEWRGFSGIEPGFRWTDGLKAAMVFECPGGTPSKGKLVLTIDTLGEQRISVTLNDRAVMHGVRAGNQIPLEIPVDNLETGINVLELELPDARRPGNGDNRLLAIAIREFTIQVPELAAT